MLSQFDSRSRSPDSRTSERVMAIDVARGFVLLGSCVCAALTPALEETPASPVRDACLAFLGHSAWHGCTFEDLGFPAYIMLIALSITLSYDRRRSRGETRSQLLRQLVIRSAILFAFATIYHGGLSGPVSEVRFTRIFHRLAIAILLSGLAELMLNTAGKVIALIAVLGGYWALLEYVPVPGYGAGNYSLEGNLNRYVDQTLLGADTYFVLSTLGVAGTCLIGLLGGTVLLGERSPGQRLTSFVGAGIVLLNLGWLADRFCPINKHLWTPSFVLYSSGWVALIFSSFYLLTDVWKWRRWTFPLQVPGENPLFAFVSIGLLPWARYADLIAGPGLTPLVGTSQPLLRAAVQVLLWWLLLYWLHRNRLLIKI